MNNGIINHVQIFCTISFLKLYLVKITSVRLLKSYFLCYIVYGLCLSAYHHLYLLHFRLLDTYFICCRGNLSPPYMLSTVSAFCNENEAMSAISNKPESFHVAIVEVMTCN